MHFFEILGWAAFVYALIYSGSKLVFAVISIVQIKLYSKLYPHIATEEEIRKYASMNNRELPVISIIAPAFNEEPIIIESAYSFLNQSYPYTEVIISSDGGTDGTLEKLIKNFQLEEADDIMSNGKVTHMPVRRYLRSTTHPNLIVIDKDNGGKSDAQNAGIAIAKGEIIAMVDSDSILEKNALVHIAGIFERDQKIIGIGTPIGVVNDSNVGPDGVEDASFPKSFWAKFQVIEYLRSFLMGRMAMQKLRGLIIISGAFAVYQKWIVEAVGGYTPESLAEDMDIDCKIWRFIDFNRLDFHISYIPEVFCWTQVPDDFTILRRQRDRWARGLTETMFQNKDLFFNRKFKLLGLFSYPYYVIFEWITPFIEVAGILYFLIVSLFGVLDLIFLSRVFLVYYIMGLIINFITIFVESSTGGHYKSSKPLKKLAVVALFEPIFYHWVNSYFYVEGNIKHLLHKSKSWGRMERKNLKKVSREADEKIGEEIDLVA